MEAISAELLTSAAKGDSAAFARIVREHQSMVFSIAWHFLQDRSLAEDLAQDVFLDLHRHIGSVQSPAHLTFWLRRTAGHRCIDFLRSRRSQPKVGLDSAPEPSVEARAPDPLLSRQLRQLVGTLPEHQRMMVILRYQEEMEPAEIAETLNVPVGTVKSTLHRGLAVLKEKLLRLQGRKA